jgi:hypothetical protein
MGMGMGMGMSMGMGTDTVPWWAYPDQLNQMQQQQLKGEADRQSIMLRAESDKNSLVSMSAAFRSPPCF